MIRRRRLSGVGSREHRARAGTRSLGASAHPGERIMCNPLGMRAGRLKANLVRRSKPSADPAVRLLLIPRLQAVRFCIRKK